MREIVLFGTKFILHSDRVLIWPQKKLLVAADLHLGEAPQNQWRGLLDIENLAQKFSVENIMFLGDFLHAPHNLTERIVQDVSDFLLRTDQDITLIPSTRDRSELKLFNSLFPKLEVLFQWQIEDFVFQHQPPERIMSTDQEFYWCGHLNPIAGGTPCFVIDDQIGVLPAFTSVPDGNEVDEVPGRSIFLCG